MQVKKYYLPLIALMLINALPAQADMIWPGMILGFGMSPMAWYVILLGLMAEVFFIKKMFELNISKAFLVTSVINLASSILGMILIPLITFFWELSMGQILFIFFKIGTFNIWTWIATFLIAVLVNVFIEGLVLKFFFRTIKFDFIHKKILLLFLANFISVGIALGFIFSSQS